MKSCLNKNMLSSPSQNTQRTITYILFFLILTGICLGMSFFIKTIGFYYEENFYPFDLPVAPVVLWVILGFITYIIISFNFYTIAPIAATLLLAGAWSNFIERLIFGYVGDYIYVWVGYINISDLMLWTGIILLNFPFWRKIDN
jgi:lipoprotein signal peptidase